MSVIDKAVRAAYEWYKRNYGPPQPPTAQAVPEASQAPPGGWIAWDDPEATEETRHDPRLPTA